jgi:16S rRNA (cytosine1402-N4)-methyltransferase
VRTAKLSQRLSLVWGFDLMDRPSPEQFEHEPVLMRQVVDSIASENPKLILDCTLGGAGHSAALLEAIPDSSLIGLDRDESAIGVARARLAPFGERVRIVHSSFEEAPKVLNELGVPGVDAILADLGVSSHQIDTAERGFSFRMDGPLDMRMDTSRGQSAAEILAEIPEKELARVIKVYGEERYSGRVARVIKEANLSTTAELADVIRSVVRKGKDKIDPATRTFQAIRMLVNGELDQLETLLNAIPDLLNDGGIAALISFHSLEDRAVKHAFRKAAKGEETPPDIPVYVQHVAPTMELVTRKPLVADDEEIRRNSRSRSAKLRVARRLSRGDN